MYLIFIYLVVFDLNTDFVLATPVEVIDHYYCFLADNLDNSVICQTMLKLEVISEKDVINSTKMSSEYRQNAFLLDLLLVTASTSIDEFCHLLQNTKNQQQLGDMLVNGEIIVGFACTVLLLNYVYYSSFSYSNKINTCR